MRTQFNPFPKVNSSRGAPMGRRGDGMANMQGRKRLHARHQGGGDGYDRGGAYWGSPCDVWAVWARMDGDVVVAYVRANSREAAIKQVRDGEA